MGEIADTLRSTLQQLPDPNGPPPLSLLPPPKTKATAGGKGTGGKAGGAELRAPIAQQVGVPPAAIERVVPPAAPEA